MRFYLAAIDVDSRELLAIYALATKHPIFGGIFAKGPYSLHQQTNHTSQ